MPATRSQEPAPQPCVPTRSPGERRIRRAAACEPTSCGLRLRRATTTSCRGAVRLRRGLRVGDPIHRPNGDAAKLRAAGAHYLRVLDRQGVARSRPPTTCARQPIPCSGAGGAAGTPSRVDRRGRRAGRRAARVTSLIAARAAATALANKPVRFLRVCARPASRGQQEAPACSARGSSCRWCRR